MNLIRRLHLWWKLRKYSVDGVAPCVVFDPENDFYYLDGKTYTARAFVDKYFLPTKDGRIVFTGELLVYSSSLTDEQLETITDKENKT